MKLTHKIGIKLLELLSKTWRIKSNYKISSEHSVVAFWHGYMLPVWYYFANLEKKAGVVSLSKDGEILAELLSSMSYDLIRGSSSKKGKEVVDKCVDKLVENTVLITPDGPRGPIYQLKPGAVVIAAKSGKPLVLCRVKIGWSSTFNSWDKFKLPLLFSTIELEFSNKIFVENPDDRENIEDIRKECENWLNHNK